MAYPMQSDYPPPAPYPSSSGYPEQQPSAPYPTDAAKQQPSAPYPTDAAKNPEAQGYPPAPYTQQPGYPAAQYPPQHDPSGERIYLLAVTSYCSDILIPHTQQRFSMALSIIMRNDKVYFMWPRGEAMEVSGSELHGYCTQYT